MQNLQLKRCVFVNTHYPRRKCHQCQWRWLCIWAKTCSEKYN